MASPLDTIRTAIASGFKGQLRTGTLRRPGYSSGVDSFGDPIPGTATTYECQGIREDYTALYKAEAGIPDEDVRILLIGGLVSVEPVQGDQIFIESKWHEVRRVESIDPAAASYTLQCFEIRDPTS